MAANEELETDVREELAWDPRFDARDIFVVADGGRITLTGSVSSESARASAEDAATRVLGVRSIDNQLVVSGTFAQQAHGPKVPPTRDSRIATTGLPYAASHSR